jgi:hypothetical protein
LEPVRLHAVPAIERAPPPLAALGEIVGRHAGDVDRTERVVELEELRVRPDVRAVHRHVDGRVANQADAPLARGAACLFPVAKEEPLEVRLILDFVAVRVGGLRERLRVAAPERGFPRRPVGTAAGVFERDVEGPVGKPRGLLGCEAKSFEFALDP